MNVSIIFREIFTILFKDISKQSEVVSGLFEKIMNDYATPPVNKDIDLFWPVSCEKRSDRNARKNLSGESNKLDETSKVSNKLSWLEYETRLLPFTGISWSSGGIWSSCNLDILYSSRKLTLTLENRNRLVELSFCALIYQKKELYYVKTLKDELPEESFWAWCLVFVYSSSQVRLVKRNTFGFFFAINTKLLVC